MRRRNQSADKADLITAAEIAEFVFCPESWRLTELGLEPGSREALEAGTRHHERKAVAERVAGGSLAVGRLLVMVALAALLLLWLVWR